MVAHKTIVIGAGLAGLSAAYELVKAGCDVQVFEAQQRVGGRVYTAQMSGGQYGELGAEFVDENHTAVKDYIAKFDLKLDLACQFPHDLYWFIDGILCNRNSLSSTQSIALDSLYAELQTLVDRQQDPLLSLDEWLEAKAFAPFASRIAQLQAHSLFATDAELIGPGFFAYPGGDSSVNMRIRGGSSRLVDALAKYLGKRVHIGNPVRRIQQTGNTAIVNVETAKGFVEIVADSAIATIPWNVLRHISLEIPIVEAQKEAIFNLQYGSAVKTLLQYSKRFWSQPNFGIVLLEGDYQAIWEPTFAQTGTRKILSCFSGGTPSLNLAQSVRNLAEEAVRTIYPDALDTIDFVSYDWSADEWIRGAYCYFGPGDLNRFNPYLTLPAGRVLFAGEHTAPVEFRGYMEGAIRSGQRAAQQVLKLQSTEEIERSNPSR
ncbi:amine oxidase [Nostoc minutum NIES-26]|uniref:Amine oxidase n=1 Tax=Nostoc minutum NIES-26 TaxID=1844469 RepID=A0A367S3U6_9NOSO|nr:amine oxidase [Nostoc minutum NIES-26]